jgi:hypothetical protein
LNSCGNTFVNVAECEWRIPSVTGDQFYGTIVIV